MQREQFFDHLRDSGLLPKEQMAAVRERLRDIDSQDLKRVLVDEGLLTPFQLCRIQAGQSKGLVLGQYRVLEELGHGGFGWVYKARHTLMNRDVALKVILPELVQDPRARSWFLREVLATTQLQHPNIVLAYDANEVDGILFLAMEFVDGPNLHTLVSDQGPLPIGLTCAMMHQAARALHYAHEKGMVHRDIKPGNILVPRGGSAHLAPQPTEAFLPTPTAFPNTPLIKIVDFGLARLHGQRTCNSLTLDKDKGFIGTPDYVSPEQARNIHDADIRSDLYSLGCTFYFALSGQRPFRGESPMEIIVQHLEVEPLAVEAYRPEIPPALASIIRRLMAKRREQRFQSPADLVAELNFLFGSRALDMMPRPAASSRGVSDRSLPARPGDSPGAHLRTHAVFAHAQPADRAMIKTTALPTIDPVDGPAQSEGPPDPGPVTRGAGAAARETMAAPSERGPAAAPQSVSAGQTATKEFAAPVIASAPADQAVDSALCRSWREWTAVIEALLHTGDAGIGESDYRALYGRLLEAARAHADVSGNSRRDLVLRLVTTVEPWVTPRALAGLDSESLYRLHRRCQDFDCALGLTPVSRRGQWWLILFTILFAGAALGGHLVFVRGLRLPTDWSVPAVWRFVLANPLVLVAVLVPLVVLVGVAATARGARRG